MNHVANQEHSRPPARWVIVVAFALLYLSWGTTFLAIKKGVEVFPPALFGGSRVATAGALLLGYLAVRGHSLRLARREFLWTALVSLLFFVGGNGLLTLGEKFVDSGAASALGATTPLWLALIEMLWPWGDRLNLRGWFGLWAGLGGVLLLLGPRLQEPATLLHDAGPLLVLGSSILWSLGSFILRYRSIRGSYLAVAGYQMLLGGSSLFLLGLLLGETEQVTRACFTPTAVYSFFHLLVVSSLVGFVAYTWLLRHVSAVLVGTHAYVNPMVAIVLGWLLNGETITGWIVSGMIIILAGVALVRDGGVQRSKERTPADELETSANGQRASSSVAFPSKAKVSE
jgi:drug/metabolite transporter (DMT)-like permease